ncbi:MAG TPA: aminoacyl-tRNA hydrolase [Acidimicrobiales bacterium]|nr:aminoacyl-tRNA hydrolase [Acidimicrobiales bacterium]
METATKPTPDRRGTPADWVFVGLGNPGDRYAHTRHNVGADVVALVADRHGEKLRSSKQQAFVAELRMREARVVVAFPQTFMNDSGRAVQLLTRRHGIDDPERLVVVHDELDLPTGRVKLKSGGGLAGHNGLKSIEAHLGTREFRRIRIGVGKPPGRMAGADYVLRRPSKADQTELDIARATAADAAESIVTDGFDATMNHVNTR